MNNTIDHAILIPAYAKTIWRHLSNPEENAAWQTNCERIAYLNSIRDARGIRYRAFGKNGQESVVEITAWYPGLGYEYVIIDGFNHTNRGRIRLQEVAEGTVVQWTFNYETSGLMGSLSNSLVIKRNLNNEIIKNLQSLYQYIGQVAERVDTNQIKAVMREAPDVENRANYQPRYPSALEADEADASRSFEFASGDRFAVENTLTSSSTQERPAVKPEPEREPFIDETPFQRPDYTDRPATEPSRTGLIIPEPPLSEVDTKPNPTVNEADEEPATISMDATQSQTQQDIHTESPATEDSAASRFVIPRPPFEPSTEEPQDPEPELTDAAETTPPVITEQAEVPPVLAPSPSYEEEPAVEPVKETEPLSAPKSAPTRDEKAATDEKEQPQPAPTIDADNIFDTSQISVFEIFGLQKPSETQETRAILGNQLGDTGEAEVDEEAEDIERGFGLRWKLRRKKVHLKHPH
ncbi:SRPBCC family protein [Phototrophicus methaneseepsis]|uniref:SRPBCC family protein n=1 Tax=Phototrophicus methaneseepsis TaxID=2710758 RepID=A0A7S8E681_9CHLR|nr:SRPBCC family protein [Phototrophicus methaneseepsis]QPC81100.1 SRPBCC family protein [Phototrophicus methaneseepsis]